MTARNVAALVAVAVILALPSRAPAPPCLVERCICRDGAATGICAQWNPAILGGRAAYFRRFRDFSCDMDRRCDGLCTFGPGYPLRLAVGERRDVGDGEGCTTRYVCKKGRRARCRKLAQRGSPSGAMLEGTE